MARGNGQDTKPNSRALPLTYFWQLTVDSVKKDWLIKGVLARGEISSWVGDPGACKSMLLTDIAVHLAAGWDWRGYKTKLKAGVVYFALERVGLTQRRLIAYQLRDGFELLPIAVAGQLIDLMRPECVQIIADSIEQAALEMDCEVGLIIIDTGNKGLAYGGGNENHAADQNRMAAHLRLLLQRHNVHIALVGHTGKEAEKGPRGSNARIADDDVTNSVTGDKIRAVATIKANDQPLGELTSFGVDSVEIGKDEDGQPISVGILGRDLFSAQQAEKKTPKPPSQHQLMLRAVLDGYDDLVDREGVEGRGFDGAVVKTIKSERLTQWLVSRSLLAVTKGKTGDVLTGASREALRKAKAELRSKRLVEKDGEIWRP